MIVEILRKNRKGKEIAPRCIQMRTREDKSIIPCIHNDQDVMCACVVLAADTELPLLFATK